MATDISLVSRALVIEIENCTNNSGEVMYRKKTFSRLNPNATPDDFLAVAEDIG